MTEINYKMNCKEGGELLVDRIVIRSCPKLKELFDTEGKLCGDFLVINIPMEANTVSNVINYLRKRCINLEDPIFINEMVEKLDADSLFEIILTSNYLNITELVKIAGDRFKSVVNDNDSDKIREIFSIKNDLESDEEADVDKNFEWQNE